MLSLFYLLSFDEQICREQIEHWSLENRTHQGSGSLLHCGDTTEKHLKGGEETASIEITKLQRHGGKAETFQKALD